MGYTVTHRPYQAENKRRRTLIPECPMSAVTELLNAIDAVVTARVSLYKARDEYQGYSWGYAGLSYIESVDQAEKEFEKAFALAVKEAVTNNQP